MQDIRIAVHQPNFIPWFPYFYKMALADKFIVLRHVQFVRGFQNRFKLTNGKWITKAVNSGRETIFEKKYTDGQDVWLLNMQWIEVIKDTLGIDTQLVYDVPLQTKSTQLLIDLIKMYHGTIYVTNEAAKDKYLDEDLMRSQGIEIEYCKVPKPLQKHTFEIFEEYGIEGAINLLPKKRHVPFSVQSPSPSFSHVENLTESK